MPSLESPSTRGFIYFLNGSIDSLCPITPVEPTITSHGLIPSSSAASFDASSAISSPSKLHVFAFLELTSTALATPPLSSRCLFVTITGAPFTLFCVYTPAALHGVSEKTIPKSFLFLSGLIPQLSPLATKPLAAHTPPSTYLKPSNSVIFMANSS